MLPGFKIILAIGVTLLVPPVVAVERSSTLELHARCPNGDPCRFTDKAVVVELELHNNGSEAVQLPLAYIRRRGPSVRMYDNQSGNATSLRTPLVAPALHGELQELAAGESVYFGFPVKPQEIGRFVRRPVDLRLEFAINLAPGADMAKVVRNHVRLVGAEEAEEGKSDIAVGYEHRPGG
jgi:hypothetical protein